MTSTHTIPIRLSSAGLLGPLRCEIIVDPASGDVRVPAEARERLESDDARVSDEAARDILGAAGELLEQLHHEAARADGRDPLDSDVVRPRIAD